MKDIKFYGLNFGIESLTSKFCGVIGRQRRWNSLRNNVQSQRLYMPLNKKVKTFFYILAYYGKQFTTKKASRTREVTNIWLDHFAFSQWQITNVKIQCL